MAQEGLGGLAKKWLKAKAQELTTADRQKRDAAEHEADETGRELKNESIGEAVMTAVPGLRKLRDRQQAGAAAAEEALAQERRDELAARPVAHLHLQASGAITDAWEGDVPALLEVVAPEPEATDDEGAEPYIDPDPYADRPRLTVDLGPLVEASAVPGKVPMHGWWFEVAGFAGAGTYDLAAIGMARRAADAEPEYIEWELAFGEDDRRFYFQPDIGPSSVTVSADLRRLDVSMSMTGEWGELTVSATLEVPSDPA